MKFLVNVIICNQFFIILMLTLVFQRSECSETEFSKKQADSSFLVQVTGKGLLPPPNYQNEEKTVLGIIIDENMILTFDKWFPDDSPVTIKAGHNSRYADESKAQIRQSVKITRHPCFPELNVAIIYMDKPLELSHDLVEPAWIRSNNDRFPSESLDKSDIAMLGQNNQTSFDGEDGLGKTKVDLVPCGGDAKYLEICIKNDTIMSAFLPSSVLIIKDSEKVEGVRDVPHVAGFLLTEDSTNNTNNEGSGLRRFLDLTKITCWLSGDLASCEDPSKGTEACGKDLNEDWWANWTNISDLSPETRSSTDEEESTTEEDLEHLNKTTPDPNASNHLNTVDFYRIGLLTLLTTATIIFSYKVI